VLLEHERLKNKGREGIKMAEASFEELLNNSMKEEKKLGKVVTGTVIQVNDKGEIFLDINYKADGIIPKSEFSFDENCNPKDEVKPGDTITATVLKRNDGEGNVLLSCKKLRKDEARKVRAEQSAKFWEETNVGDKFDGKVVSICSYGAFVDVGGVQGLLHISEMSWDRNEKAQDIVKEGDVIKVTVKDIDKENKRIQLSYDDKGENPWNTYSGNVGDVVKVKIKKLVPFGAFAEVEKGIEGLIHISQISTKRIAKPEEVLKEGDEVNAKIINLDKENKKLELSIRELEGTSNEYSSQGDEDENKEIEENGEQ